MREKVSFLAIKKSFTLSKFCLGIKMASSAKDDMSLILFSSVALILVHYSVRFFIFAKSEIFFISDFALREGSST